MQQGAEVEVATRCGAFETVDDHGGTAPPRAAHLHEGVGCLRLRTGRGPIVDEQHDIAGPEKVAANAELEVFVAIVGSGGHLPPCVTVRCSTRVLSNLRETHPEVPRGEDTQQASSGLRSHDDRRLLIGEETGECGANAIKDLGVSPPPGDIRPQVRIHAVAQPTKRSAQLMAKFWHRIIVSHRPGRAGVPELNRVPGTLLQGTDAVAVAPHSIAAVDMCAPSRRSHTTTFTIEGRPRPVSSGLRPEGELANSRIAGVPVMEPFSDWQPVKWCATRGQLRDADHRQILRDTD